MTSRRHGISPLLAALALALVLTTVACANQPPATWRKSGAVQENWNRDKIDCRSLARRKVNREYRAEASQIGSGEYQAGGTLNQSMNRFEAKKRQTRLFKACLKSRGYEIKKPAPQKN